MTEPNADSVRRASDYEEYMGEGRWQIYKGNPKYCMVAETHTPHEFRYVYLDKDDLLTRGGYYCDGIGIDYPERLQIDRSGAESHD